MPIRFLTDADIDPRADMPLAIEAIEHALAARRAGTFVAPPRHHVALGAAGELVFTVGGVVGDGGGAFGFRAYETFPGVGPGRAQVVAAWDTATSDLAGVVVGNTLGALRTGAIGGVAIRHMARADAPIAAVIGAGEQARTQLIAAAAVRTLREVRVFSRAEDGRRRFARDMAAALGIPVRVVASARAAVEGATLVLCATTSTAPVLEAAWLEQGTHVNTVGPKVQGGHELGVDVAARAAVIATDSPAQARAYGKPFFLDGTPHMARMADLADIAGGVVAGRLDEAATSLFCSTGLAGTEVLVAQALLARA